MSNKAPKSAVIAILALAANPLQGIRRTGQGVEDKEQEQRAKRQLALAEQRRQLKKARRAIPFRRG